MKALSIVLGLLLIVGGIMSIVNPASIMMSLGTLMGLFILVHGVGSLITYFRFRPWAEGWGAAGAILSIVLGILLMTSAMLKLYANLVLVFAAGLWMLSAGVVGVVMAVRLFKMGRTRSRGRHGTGWAVLLLLGIVLIGLGVVAFVHPVVSAMTIGVLLGVHVIAAGVELIAAACCKPQY